MKKILFILLVAIGMASCNTVEVETASAFKVSIGALPSQDDMMVGDTVVIKKGESLTFNLERCPDYITFYSGELHANYAYAGMSQRNSDSSLVSFSTAIASGNQGALSLLASNDFSGTMDSENIAKANWIVVPKTRFATSSAFDSVKNIRIDNIPGIDKNKPVYLAFRFASDTAKTSSVLPRSWTINWFTFKNYFSTPNLACLGINMPDTVYTLASDFRTGGFQQASLKNNLNYWYYTNTKYTFTLNSNTVGALPDEDWVISRALDMRNVWPDYGTYLKSMNDQSDLTTYSYKYARAGVYVATFVGMNANYNGTSKVIRQIPVKVVNP